MATDSSLISAAPQCQTAEYSETNFSVQLSENFEDDRISGEENTSLCSEDVRYSGNFATKFVHIIDDHSENLRHMLHQQWLKGQYCDLKVKVKDQEFKVHSCVLAAFSAVLCQLDKNMLFRLPEVQYSGIAPLVKMMYTGILCFDLADAPYVAEAAKSLMMTDIYQACQEYIAQCHKTGLTVSHVDHTIINSERTRVSAMIKGKRDQSPEDRHLSPGSVPKHLSGDKQNKNCVQTSKVAKLNVNSESLAFNFPVTIKTEAKGQAENELCRDSQNKNGEYDGIRPRQNEREEVLQGQEGNEDRAVLQGQERNEARAFLQGDKGNEDRAVLQGHERNEGKMLEQDEEMFMLPRHTESDEREEAEDGSPDEDEICATQYAASPTRQKDESRQILAGSHSTDTTLSRYLARPEQNILKCSQCGIEFGRQSNLTRHMRVIHSSLCHLRCKFCTITTKTERELREHCQKDHCISNPFPCDFPGCQYVTNKYDKLYNHQRVHSNVRNFVCDKCGKSFASQNNLRSHLRTCYRLKEYLCDLCGQVFNHSQSMKSHRRSIHGGEKPFTCDECGKYFSDHRNMKRHKRIHENAFPYACRICGQKYRHSNSLKCHMKKHSDVTSDESI